MHLFDFLRCRPAAALLFMMLAAGTLAAAAPAAAHGHGPSPLGAADAAAAQRVWLPLAEVYRRLAAQGYREVLRIERYALGYEAVVPGPDRRRLRVFIDPHNGQVLGQGADRSEAPR